MNFFRKWKHWADLQVALALFRAPLPYLKYLHSYFVERYDKKESLSPFVWGISEFAVGYCPARQILEKYISPLNIYGQIAHISEPEFLEALDWMERGVRRMSDDDSRMRKKEVIIYCGAIYEFSAFSERAGNHNAALRSLEHGIRFAECYASEKLDSKTQDKLYCMRAIDLAYAGRYDEAIHAYPSKDVLSAIQHAKGRPGTAGRMIDMLPYVMYVKENAQDPNGRCSDEDLEYVNRWLSSFFLSTGSYAEVLALGLEDIIVNKIGKKKNRHAITAYLDFAYSASQLELWDYTKTSLSTAYQMALDVLDPRIDLDAALFYDIFFLYCNLYFSEQDLKEADFVLGRALDFLNKRVAMQREEKGADTVICEIDCDARENIMLQKAHLLSVQGQMNEALEFSQWVVDSHRKRREAAPDRYKGTFDSFYVDALANNTLNLLRVDQNRTIRSDEQIQAMIQENVHIIDELKLITLDDMRENSICDIQIWADVILSYWIQFPDSTISAEQLYTFELNTKNIDPDIRYLQNRSLDSADILSKNKTVDQERRDLWEDYQKAMFEDDGLKNTGQQFRDRRIALDAERYQFLKNSGYNFTYCELSTLQARLGDCRTILEYRKFVRYDLAHNATSGSYWYGAFLITGGSAMFALIGDAEEIETSISEFLLDFQDADMLDWETVSGNKLRRLENALLVPFRDELLQIEELYIVPDNELYNVPFELMPMWKRGDAVEEGTDVKICYLTSARSILRDRKVGDSYQSIRVIANPEFNIEDNYEKDSTHKSEELPRVMDDVRSVLLNAGISHLKYSEFEAEAIANVFADNCADVEIVQGRQARKDNVFTKQADILHFATHGFAIPTRLDKKEQECVPTGNVAYMERVYRIAACGDALLRCGLLLSGVDNWLRGTEVDGFENGILTGMDILLEDLSGCRLVVLSACNTGQGDVSHSGNGIEGLRSAFEVAGVPALVCTLWDIDDFSTALFMTEFYRGLYSTKNPLSALNIAKHTIREMTYIDLERRGFKKQADNLFNRRMALSMEEKVFAHPKYWAGFILHGAVL